MNLLVIDNYDSFTYNLVYMLRSLGVEPAIFRNDKITLQDALAYDAVLISPGPGVPSQAGISLDVIRNFSPHKPLLGVCLGHQALGLAYGSQLVNLPAVYHGLSIPVHLQGADPLFIGMPEGFKAGRYHSWAVLPDTVKPPLLVLATDPEGHVMAIRHAGRPHYGVQFHPESVLTEGGEILIKNWLAMAPESISKAA